ncbi:MAG: AI-2E family transporter, partial [Pseudomonadota bacterium]
TFAICALFGVAGAPFWGFIAFILNFIPTLGSIMAVVLPATYALLTLSDPGALIGVIALLSATQFLAGEIVLPRVMGDSLNLSSVVVLFALVFWGTLWGPVGMFLGIPITVIAMVVCARIDGLRGVAIALSKDGRLPID